MLQDATRRWRSSKATKQTRTRRCKTFKCCKMLLEDEGDEDCKYPRPPCALAKILPETTVLAWFRQIENASPLQTHFLLFQQIFFVLVCIHPGTPRVPPRALASGPKPCGGNYIIEFENIVFYRGLLCRCILQCRVCHKQEQKSLKTSGSQDQSRSTEEKATRKDIKGGYL